MFFGCDGDTFFGLFKLKKGNDLIRHKLGCDRSAQQSWEFAFTHRNILLNLHHAEFISTTFGLNRQHINKNADLRFEIGILVLRL